MGKSSNVFEEKGVLKKKCTECGANVTLVDWKGVRSYGSHRNLVSGRVCKMSYRPVSCGTSQRGK